MLHCHRLRPAAGPLPVRSGPPTATRRASWSWRALLLGASLAAAPLSAAVLNVGPDQPYLRVADAIAAAQDGDTIRIAPGIYRGDVAVITQRRLTIEAMGEQPIIEAAGQDAEGKAIWVVRGGDVHIHNIAFRGARVPHGNGAAIRLERGRLSVHRGLFTDNEMGLLTSNDAQTELRISQSRFADAPRTPGPLHHLLYVGRVARFELTDSHFSNGWRGHLVKSRAKVSRLFHNRLVDGPGGEASYEVDLPNGGDAVLVGNVIGQSEGSQNAVLVSYGAEAAAWPDSRLLLVHNTLVSDRAEAVMLRSWTERLPPATPIWALNNLLIGPAPLTTGIAVDVDGNVVGPLAWLRRAANDDARHGRHGLRADVPARGRAVDVRGLLAAEAVPAPSAGIGAAMVTGTAPGPAWPPPGAVPGAAQD